MKLSRILTLLADDPDYPVDLARVALLIARDAYSRMNPRSYLRRIDRLAQEVRPRLRGSLESRTAALSTFLFEECGFAGNSAHYYDPRNSYLNKVLDRQVGLPISLSLLAMAVGERAGLTVVGVPLPGHFVAKAVGPKGDEVLFDPFNGGEFLDAEGCEALVGAITGRAFEATPEALEATCPAAFVLRMLNNLKTAYLADRAHLKAARVTHRLCQLLPDEPTQRRDLGLLLVRSEQHGAAIDHLQHYLQAIPSADDADDVRTILARAFGEVAKWN
jgi:regulator of sirC expression with transglutaminase-like and TPR domain